MSDRVWWKDGTTSESMQNLPKDRARIEKLNVVASAVSKAFGGYAPFSVRFGIASEVLKALDDADKD